MSKTEEKTKTAKIVLPVTGKTLKPPVLAYDMFHNRIQAGDYINYPGRKGNDTYMRTAKVLSVKKRQLTAEKPEVVLSVAMAKAPRHWERAKGNWNTKVIKTTVSVPFRATVIPKAYVENDKRYACLLDV